MSQQIEQLQAERATLMDRNSILEQVHPTELPLSQYGSHSNLSHLDRLLTAASVRQWSTTHC